jgi:ligand-binding sensor domain-containing protein
MIASSSQIGDVKDIEVGSDSKVYVAASDGLWRWDKSIWVKLAPPPKGIPSALAIDRKSTMDILYLGTTEEGVYSSTDGGRTWRAQNSGLGDLRIKKLAINTGVDRKLYAGTWKGVWRTNLEGNYSGRSHPGVLTLLLD